MQTDTAFPVQPVTSGPRHRTVPTVLGDLLLVADHQAFAGVFPGHGTRRPTIRWPAGTCRRPIRR